MILCLEPYLLVIDPGPLLFRDCSLRGLSSAFNCLRQEIAPPHWNRLLSISRRFSPELINLDTVA
jgi:hypothetical protein